jgi:ATP-dependent helicase/nuclease subunit B
MSVKFIIGPAGSGKTQYCFERIVDSIRKDPLGPPIYWILPRQATFIVERQLACSAGMHGYFRVRILGFEDLGTEILSECGGTALPEITDRGRRMILGHILREAGDQLQFFRSVAHQPGVAAELDATFAELERAGHEAANLEQQLQSAPGTPALQAKIHDLALIYSRYTKFLGQDRIDPNRRLAESLSSIARCRSLRNADVYIDSFYDFTGSERKLITALGKACPSVSITLTLDPQSPCIDNPHLIPDEMSLFHRCEQAYRRLWFTMQEESVEVSAPVLLKEPRRFRNPQLSRLERAFVSPATPPAKAAAGIQAIHLIKAPDFQTEVDSTARWIRRLIDEGMRYRDIVVLMRSQDDYQHLIEASFREHNIPFFADRRRSASHHPLLRFIRAVLAVATTNWSHDSMMAVIKTGLVDLPETDADALENYVLLHGIDHTIWISPKPWTGRRSRSEDSDPAPVSDAAAMDALRRPLVDRLQPFVTSVRQSDATVRSHASALFRFLEDFQCRNQIVSWIDSAASAGRLEEGGEHERVWEELVKLFDELVDLFGDEPITLKDFCAIIDSALEGFDLALTPPTVDQVLVGTVDRTRTPPVKACAVLGLAEGQFPRASPENSIFTDADRRNLGQSKIDLDPDSSRRLLDENFLGYLALTRASERLLLTRRVSDADGRALGPSPIWQRVVAAFPDLREYEMPRAADLPPHLITTPRQLVGSLMNWVRGGAIEPAWEPVYQWFSAHATCDDAVDIARFHAWKALSYRNDAALDPGRAAEMFPSPLRATARQLESFRMCPYQHFARYGLGLNERRQRNVGPGDLSRIFHEVLRELVKELIDSSQSWQDMEDADAKRRLSRLTAHVGEYLRDELMLSTARNRYLLGHVEKTLGLIASAQKSAAQRGGFHPAFVEIGFGSKPDDRMPHLALRTPAGNETLLAGKIDRVDLLPDGSASAMDYRLSADALDAAGAYHGLYLQLLSYLLVLEKNGRHLTREGNLSPAAAFCVGLSRSVRKDDPLNAPAPDDPRFHLMVKPRGVFDLRVARQLDNSLTEGNSEVVQLYIKKDGAVGHPDRSDAAAGAEFSALLRHMEHRIGQIADEIMAGRIDIRPYRMGLDTPCPRCEFRALCRLEPSPGCYDDLETMKRDQMLQRVVEEQGKSK